MTKLQEELQAELNTKEDNETDTETKLEEMHSATVNLDLYGYNTIKMSNQQITFKNNKNICFQFNFVEFIDLQQLQTLTYVTNLQIRLYNSNEEEDINDIVNLNFKSNKELKKFVQNINGNEQSYDLNFQIPNVTLKWIKSPENIQISFENDKIGLKFAQMACGALQSIPKSEYVDIASVKNGIKIFTAIEIYRNHKQVEFGDDEDNRILIRFKKEKDFNFIAFETDFYGSHVEKKNDFEREKRFAEIKQKLQNRVDYSYSKIQNLNESITKHKFPMRNELDKFSISECPNPLPLNDRGNGPKLLIYDLDGAKKKTRSIATQEIIDGLSETYCIGVIGTSGCGKTRSIFEVLAKRYGLFFITDRSHNGGSDDLYNLVKVISKMCSRPLQLDENKEEPLDDVSRTFYNEFKSMVHLRILLLCVLIENFGESFTPLHWLYVQEMPSLFFGLDIFACMSDQYFLNLSPDDIVKLKFLELRDGTKRAFGFEDTLYYLEPSGNFPVCVDEIQQLMTWLENKCVSLTYLRDVILVPKNLDKSIITNGATKQSDQTNQTDQPIKGSRSGVTIVLHAITSLNNTFLPKASLVAVFSGTGIRFDQLDEDTRSIAAKNLVLKKHVYVFSFGNFSAKNTDNSDEFSKYVKHFFKTIISDNMLVDLHRVLKGRCRFTASFVELVLASIKKNEQLAPQNSSTIVEESIYKAVESINTSICNLVKIVLRKRQVDLYQKLIDITFTFFWHGSLFSSPFNSASNEETKSEYKNERPILLRLIEYGVCHFKQESAKSTRYKVELTEPIFLNALFKILDTAIMRTIHKIFEECNSNHVQKGNGFEEVVAYTLFKKPDCIKKMFGEDFELNNTCLFTSKAMPYLDKLKMCFRPIVQDFKNKTVEEIINENYENPKYPMIHPYSQNKNRSSPDLIVFLKKCAINSSSISEHRIGLVSIRLRLGVDKDKIYEDVKSVVTENIVDPKMLKDPKITERFIRSVVSGGRVFSVEDESKKSDLMKQYGLSSFIDAKGLADLLGYIGKLVVESINSLEREKGILTLKPFQFITRRLWNNDDEFNSLMSCDGNTNPYEDA